MATNSFCVSGPPENIPVSVSQDLAQSSRSRFFVEVAKSGKVVIIDNLCRNSREEPLAIALNDDDLLQLRVLIKFAHPEFCDRLSAGSTAVISLVQPFIVSWNDSEEVGGFQESKQDTSSSTADVINLLEEFERCEKTAFHLSGPGAGKYAYLVQRICQTLSKTKFHALQNVLQTSEPNTLELISQLSEALPDFAMKVVRFHQKTGLCSQLFEPTWSPYFLAIAARVSTRSVIFSSLGHNTCMFYVGAAPLVQMRHECAGRGKGVGKAKGKGAFAVRMKDRIMAYNKLCGDVCEDSNVDRGNIVY